MTPERAEKFLAAAQATTGNRHQQPPGQRLTAAMPKRPSRRLQPQAARQRLGNLHDDERQLGLQIERERFLLSFVWSAIVVRRGHKPESLLTAK